MRWDVKHDKAKGIIEKALCEAEKWFTDKEAIEGLTQEEVGEVNGELTIMIESIRKRYKLQERLAVTAEQELKKEVEEAPAETEKEEEPVEEKPKRKRKVSADTEKKPRIRKKKEADKNEDNE